MQYRSNVNTPINYFLVLYIFSPSYTHLVNCNTLFTTVIFYLLFLFHVKNVFSGYFVLNEIVRYLDITEKSKNHVIYYVLSNFSL